MIYSNIQTLVFDSSNILLDQKKSFDRNNIPSRLEPIQGFHDALMNLQKNYQMIFATDADLSINEVKDILKSVDLDKFFDSIFSKKSPLDYFRTIQNTCEIPANQITIIGKAYKTNIMGGYQAGWKTIWYNPHHLLAPGLLPIQDAEFSDISILENILQKEDFPSWNTCQTWMIEQGTSPQLFKHVLMVASIAYTIAILLQRKGYEINPLLAHRGGFLHDLCKFATPSNQPPEKSHGEKASILLREKGYPQLADIARTHGFHCLTNVEKRPQSWEQKLVNYGDRLVERDQLVGIETRMKRLCERYHLSPQFYGKCISAINELQEEICQALSFSNEELFNTLEQILIKGTETVQY
ncbi:MAG: HD domain-containing protein [Anaerolineaceae bacterium]|nr:HD domain-containing protein [Anaerolineaceae bacterium]